MKTWKKIVAIGVASMFLLGGLVGCTKTPYSQEDLDKAVKMAKESAYMEKQITIDDLNSQIAELSKKASENAEKIAELEEQKKKLEEQAERDAQIIADYEAALAEIEEEETEASNAKLIDDIEFGEAVQLSLDDSDLPLFDGKVTFAEDEYDVHEEFNIDLLLEINGLGYEKDFYANPYLVGDSGDLEYKYVFDDGIDLSDITEDEPLEINFLGKQLTIVDVDSNSITLKSGTEYFKYEGETVDINGVPLEVVLVGDNEVMFSYGDETETISEYETAKIGGLDIAVEEVLNNYRNGAVNFVVGDDVFKTIEDGDEWIEDVEEFVFNIQTNGGELESLGVIYDVRFDELDDEHPPLGVGDSVVFPNNYITLTFDSLKDVSYEQCEIYFDDIDAKDDLATDENAVVVRCDEPIIEINNEEVEKMFIVSSGDFYYYDDEGNIIKDASNTATITNEDMSLDVVFAGTGKLKFEEPTRKEIRFDTDVTNQRFGLEEEEAEDGDVKYGGNDFGDLDGDLLTQTGVIVKDVESYADNDEARLLIPDAQVLANIVVSLVN